MKVIGLISGTSADGIDAALLEIKGPPKKESVELLRFLTFPYPRGMRERLFRLTASGTAEEVCHLNFYLGELFADAALKITALGGYRPEEIELIGSHGQTVFHQPVPKKEKGRFIRSTLQIAEPSVITERTGITTVADFRPRDIAAGGHGAPLTPRFHYRLFHHPDRSRLVINIGGISNLTFIPAGKGPKAVTAFDCGPGNMLIDGIVSAKSRGLDRMDRMGRLAKSGKVYPGLLAKLLKDPFLKKTPPKTTGREAFGEERCLSIMKQGSKLRLSTPDLIATVTAFTARSIVLSFKRFVKLDRSSVEVIVGGGGGRNPVLMRFLAEAFGSVPVYTFEDFGMDGKAVEAMAFGLLAYETMRGISNNLPSATGGRAEVVLGKIIPGRRGLSFERRS